MTEGSENSNSRILKDRKQSNICSISGKLFVLLPQPNFEPRCLIGNIVHLRADCGQFCTFSWQRSMQVSKEILTVQKAQDIPVIQLEESGKCFKTHFCLPIFFFNKDNFLLSCLWVFLLFWSNRSMTHFVSMGFHFFFSFFFFFFFSVYLFPGSMKKGS